MNRTKDGRKHPEEVTLRLVQDHAAELLRFARRFSICADDAHDAYQRGIEILVRRMRTEPPEHPLNWLRTVIRREAAMVRMERERLLGRQEVDLDREEARHIEDPSERVAGHERLGHVAEALQRLKPQEVTALVLRAEGLSYNEICARMDWSYTKTNRCVTEGRRALRDRLGAIESGAECDRWLGQLSLLADGEATARQVADLRPHLRACSACRATLRTFHDAPRQVAALAPVALVPVVGGGDPGGTLRHLEAVVHALVERATLVATRVQGAFDTLPATKVAAVAASTAVLAGGGAAIQQAASNASMRPAAQTGSASPVARAPLSLASFVPATSRAGGANGPEARAEADREAAPSGEFGVEGASAPPAEFAGGGADTATEPTATSAARSSGRATPTPAFTPPPAPAPASASASSEFAGP